ncbi:MAG: heavy metal-associated domain-containing protein [Rhodospirillaceae bacterium]
MTERYRVGGMTCQGCARSVSAAIGRAVPGARIDIDVAAGLVTVEGQAAADAVRKAVEGAGFDFLGAAP